MNMQIMKVFLPEHIQNCMDIRIKVFVEGQNVPIEMEVDGKDSVSEHYLLLIDDEPVGTARVRFVEDFAKIERVAILDAYQGKGLGKAIMKVILSDLKNNKSNSFAKLSSQTYAISFYEKLGFVVCSEEYTDAGIPHHDMKLKIN